LLSHADRQTLDLGRGSCQPTLSNGVVVRLWRDQGKVGDARELLAPAYGGFTAGFGTPDLMVATILPDQPG
jgi:hypothetical protein